MNLSSKILPQVPSEAYNLEQDKLHGSHSCTEELGILNKGNPLRS